MFSSMVPLYEGKKEGGNSTLQTHALHWTSAGHYPKSEFHHYQTRHILLLGHSSTLTKFIDAAKFFYQVTTEDSYRSAEVQYNFHSNIIQSAPDIIQNTFKPKKLRLAFSL